MTRLIQFRFTKDLKYNTYHRPHSIIEYSRHQMEQLWTVFFPSTNPPISVTKDTIENYDCVWIVNRQYSPMGPTTAALNPSQLHQLKLNLPKTGVIVAIHGGALCMGSATHLVPYLTLLSAYISNVLGHEQIAPPILAFDYRLAPECAYPCQLIDVSFMVNKYLHQTLAVDMKHIFLIGDSSGASLALLFMQRMANTFNHQPRYNVGGAVLISAGCDWTLNDGKGSWQRNAQFDPVIFYDNIKLYRRYAFGVYEVDPTTLHRIAKNNNKSHDSDVERQQCDAIENSIDFKSPKISPCFGSFDGFPALYITVSELEALYDDSVLIYNKALAVKGEQPTLEINYGSAMHELPMMAGVIPEATHALRNIAHFLGNLTRPLRHDMHI
eukprot:CAMPEP_0202724588 /NCGR_PEP_ID=MMETSP1385-20130828/174924_1 /ASSEMBLY_ACC=CAM_ASM_000861 /TAXON_ID=933848 /ORGANISM="Elphidium margaritaceum" /LENGTH=382 /DNA_ID=CAMNT_0049390235 /DNA_START=217 /DNA_END=1365 /DNA_ORIENTATION=+